MMIAADSSKSSWLQSSSSDVQLEFHPPMQLNQICFCRQQSNGKSGRHWAAWGVQGCEVGWLLAGIISNIWLTYDDRLPYASTKQRMWVGYANPRIGIGWHGEHPQLDYNVLCYVVVGIFKRDGRIVLTHVRISSDLTGAYRRYKNCRRSYANSYRFSALIYLSSLAT